MEVRELLRYEIWSKKTTQGILLGFGITVCSLLVTLKVWYEVDSHWLTNGEKAAAKAALQRIDMLQNSNSLTFQEYEVRSKASGIAVDAARLAARTSRDERTQMQLENCLVGFMTVREALIEQQLAQTGKLHQSASDRERSASVEHFLIDSGRRSCEELHKELD